MNSLKRLIPPVAVLVSLVAYVSCASNPTPASSARTPASGRSTLPSGTPAITNSIIPKGTAGRWRVRAMKPRYITIHSTQNRSRGAGAAMHAKALRNGSLTATRNSLKFLTWHYSVDDQSIHQHLPDNEQGQHADYEGHGNRYSIGIEICENVDSSREVATDRAAKLAAGLMHKHGIKIENIKAHYHWERIRYTDGKNLGHKNCPHFLMTNGKPGPKWDAYVLKIQRYYQAMR